MNTRAWGILFPTVMAVTGLVQYPSGLTITGVLPGKLACGTGEAATNSDR